MVEIMLAQKSNQHGGKKRRDDVEIPALYYVNTEAAFTPYSYRFFV